MTSKAEKRKVIPFHENQNCIQPSSSCFPMWKYLVMVIRMLSLDLRLKGKRAGERQAQEFTFAEMPWLNNKAYIYRTTLKTSESHLLSLVTDLSNDFLTLKAAHKNQKQMKKKNGRFHMTVVFMLRKKNFSFTSQIYFPIHLTVGSLVETYLQEEDKAWANYPKNKLSSVRGL